MYARHNPAVMDASTAAGYLTWAALALGGTPGRATPPAAASRRQRHTSLTRRSDHMASTLVAEANRACLDACTECAQACEACAQACLTDTAMTECTRLCLDCAAICQACVTLLARGSARASRLCQLCADLCDARMRTLRHGRMPRMRPHLPRLRRTVPRDGRLNRQPRPMPPKLPGRRPPALPTQRLVLAADVTGIPAGQRRPRSTATPGQCLHCAG